MKDLIISINQAFYLDEIEENMYDRAIKLIKSDIAFFGMDSDFKLYYKKNNNEVVYEEINFKKKYMSSDFKFDNPQFANTNLKLENIFRELSVYAQEKEIWIEPRYHWDLFLYPFQVKIKKENIWIYPILKIFEKNIVIVNFYIYKYVNIKNQRYLDVYSDMYRNEFQGLLLPINYTIEDIRIGKEISKEIKGEKINYIKVKMTDKLNNIKVLAKYLLSFFGNYTKNWIVYGRNAFLINDNRVDDTFIDTLLKGARGNFVKELKDMSINKEVKKYYNERATVYVGKNVLKYTSSVQAIEDMMMLQTIEDNILTYAIHEDKFKYNELKKIYMNMLYNEIDERTSNYGEVEEILQGQHSFLKRNKRIEYLKHCVEEKIKEKETGYQEKIEFFALLLSAGPIVEYILFPVLNSILHCNKVYNIITYLKSTNLGIFIDKDILKMICFIFVIVIFIVVYKKRNKKR